ncbi:MAG: hypothetical protein HY602_02245 [Parcubacteria group bacterium]|nr:hypothetical protein [Parcubacteria group bacterium]
MPYSFTRGGYFSRKGAWFNRKTGARSGFSYHEKPSFYCRIRDKYFGVLAICILFVQFYLIFLSGYFDIKYISAAGFGLIPENEFNEIADQYLGEKKFLIFRSKNIFLFNQSELLKRVSLTFQLGDLIAAKNFLDLSVQIQIKEREPIAVLEDGEISYLIDGLGYLILKVPYYHRIYPIIHNENEALKAKLNIGSQIFTEKAMDALLEIDHRLTVEGRLKITRYKLTNSPQFEIVEHQEDVEENVKEGQNPTEQPLPPVTLAIAPSDGFYYPELTAVTDKGVEIYFGNEPFQDNPHVAAQISNLILLIQKEKLLVKKLHYIDVRFVNKLFFK